MSETYGFGEESTEQAPDAAVAPKFYRDYMDKVSKQLQALQDKNDALERIQTQQAVKDALTAKGYAPTAAQLYTGTPDKLDDWLGTYGAALAKTAAESGEQGQGGVQGTPQTVVTPESQAAMAAFSAAGTDGAPALGGDDQLAARLRAAKTLEELEAIERENGSKFV